MKIIAILAACLALASASPYPYRQEERRYEASEQAVPTPGPVNSRNLDYFLPGSTIKMYGYAPPSGKFVCDLIPIYTGPLHGEQAICLRLEVDIDTYHITRNSLAHGDEWFAPETEGYSGYLPGRYFSMSIVVQMYSYAIIVNDYHFATYQHRIPFTKSMRLQCDSHVRLEPYEYY